MVTTLGDDLDGLTRLHAGGDRRGTERPISAMAVSTYIGLAITLGSLIFWSGYNYHGLSEMREKHVELERTIKDDYVRKDVNQLLLINIQLKLDEISSQLQQHGTR